MATPYADLLARHRELTELLARPETATDPRLLATYGRELARLEPIVAAAGRRDATTQALVSARGLLEDADPDVRAMAREEITTLEAELTAPFARGSTRVALAYHWLAEDGTTVVAEGLRSPLPEDVPPGGTAKVELEIATPKKPGRYVLRVGALRERLAWFADRDPASVRTLPIDVLPTE